MVVSLHDVSPHTWEPCARILETLRGVGVSHVSLLVVPNHHHRGHFLERLDFCEWLRGQVTLGCEAVVHGYFHQREARVGETLRERMITRSYTAGEGEFFDISREAARELVSRALGEFERAGLRSTGFIAPAWLLSAEGEEALRDLGLSYTTRLGGVWNFRNGTVEKSQSLCWSVRAAWRRVVSVGWNACLFHRLEHAPLLRVAIHPVDIGHSRVWEQILRMVEAGLLRRRAVTYAEWVESDER